MRILYVEDNFIDADLTRRKLARRAPEFRLDIASSLSEAAACLDQSTYDLVLTDLHLLDGDGMEVLALIRGRNLPTAVVMVTGSGDDAKAVTALKAGADDYVVKRADYLDRLPQILRLAVANFRAATERRTRALRVLYVEQDPQDFELTRRHLAQHAPHLRLVEAAPGADWHSHLLPPAEAVDVLLLDYQLPGLGALEILKEIRDERRLDLPVVVLTHQGEEDTALQALKLGAADYVVKSPGYLNRLPLVIENAHYRRQAIRDQTALRESEAKFRALAESAAALILIFQDGLIRYVNTQTDLITGYTADELVQLPDPLAFIHPDYRDSIRQIYRSRLTDPHGAARLEAEIITKWGEHRWVDLTLGVTELSGAPATITTVYDITQRKVVELALERERASLAERVAERTTELSIANAELARAARLKDEFLASMSHELRTPLHAILSMSETLEEGLYGPLTEKQQRYLRTIIESGQHLLSLINDVLDLSKIEAGKLLPNLDDVNVDLVCRASLGLVREQASRKRLHTTLDLDPQLKTIYADQRRLKQMLVNLLSNAVKFTPEGGQIGLEAARDDALGAARFTVWDTGIGIAAEDLPRLFQTFVQLDSGHARQYAGTGLGLALVARMVRLHGGSVSVESQVGVGSRFNIWLPLPAEPGAASAAELKPGTAGARPVLALIINDSPSAAERLAQLAADLGLRTALHRHGQGAVAQAADLQPQVILLDQQLRGVEVSALLAELAAHPRTAHIPVVAVGAAGQTPLAGLPAVTQPVSRDQLQAALAACLARPSGARAQVLLVEDTENVVSQYSEFLTRAGHQVQVARTSREAIERARENRPDLILIDLEMPDIDGLAATRLMRQDPALASLPIIALTALAMPGDRERCLAAGMSDYLSKPITPTQLGQVVERHLRRADPAAPSEPHATR